MYGRMHQSTRTGLLREEGAYVPGARRRERGRNYRPERRKYRKLRRLAAETGISIELLLLRRRTDRKWQALVALCGSDAVCTWYEGLDYRYAVRLVEPTRIRHEIRRNLNKDGEYVQVTEEKSSRALVVEIVGFFDIRGIYPPPLYAPRHLYLGTYPIEPGTQRTVLPRYLKPPLDPSYYPAPDWKPKPPMTLAGIVEEQRAYARGLADEYGEKDPKWAESWRKNVALWDEWEAKVAAGPALQP